MLVCVDRKEASRGNGKQRMLELASYGLTGLTAILVIAFCFAYRDELPNSREKFSHDRISDANLSDFRINDGATLNPGFQNDRGSEKALDG